MKAAYYCGIGDVRFEETDCPAITDNELLLKVHASAICGTDLRIIQNGHFKIPVGQRRALSHEFAGEIAAVGAAVQDWQSGMRVSVVPNVGCGHCRMCRMGLNQLCPDYDAFGITFDGGFAEYIRVPEAAITHGNLIPMADTLSYEEAALIEPFACTWHAGDRLQTGPQDTVLIIGAGPIGACHVMVSRLAGAARILVADLSPERLAQIRPFGADVLIDSSREDLLQAVRRETNGQMADVVITACSDPAMQTLALELAAPRGRINFFGGMPKGREWVSLYTNHIHYKELTVLATTGCSYADYAAAAKAAASGSVPLQRLISRQFPIEDIHAALDYARSGRGMKVLLHFR